MGGRREESAGFAFEIGGVEAAVGVGGGCVAAAVAADEVFLGWLEAAEELELEGVAFALLESGR